MVVDLAAPREVRWPANGPAMLARQICGVYAMPIALAGEYVGAPQRWSGSEHTLMPPAPPLP